MEADSAPLSTESEPRKSRQGLLVRLSARLRPDTLRSILISLIFVVLAPLLLADLCIYLMRIAPLASEQRDEALWCAVRGAATDVGVILLVALISLLAARIVGRCLTRPLHALREYAAAVGAGRLEGNVVIERPRELRELAEAFNRMASELKSRQDTLIASNRELEAQASEDWRLTNETRKANAVLETIFNTVPAGILLCDAEGRFVNSNLAARRVLGEAPTGDAFGPRGGYSQRLPDGSPFPITALPLVRAIRHGTQSRNVEMTVRRRDGSEVTVLVSASPVLDESGAIAGAVAVLLDITDRKQAERALLESEERYRTMVESMGDGVAVKDACRRYVMVNSEYLRRLGREANDVIGKTAEEIYDRNYADAILDEDLRVLRTGEAIEVERPFATRDGELLLLVRRAPIRDKCGRILGLLSVSRDITDRKRAEERAAKYAAEQRQMREQMEDIIRTVSHDLRSPLTVIVGHAGILHKTMERNRDNPRYLQGMQAILAASTQMNSMIQDLVDATRLETQQVLLDLAWVDVAQFLRELVDKLEGILETDRVRISAAPGIRPAHADASRLERIAMNLLTNALKYSPEEMPVEISVEQQGEEVVVSVSDRGAGIPPEQLPHLFEKFGGPARTRKRGDSLGLGLYITKGLVDAHGGRIWVESTPGEGTTFYFTLPSLPSSTRGI